MLTLDIETEAIADSGPTLPRPIGLGLRWPDGQDHYYTDWRQMGTALAHAWDEELCGHNILAFDIPVLQHWFKLPPRDPLRTHDTLLLAYLHDPHSRTLALKGLTERDTNEQDELHDWIMRNTDCKSRKKAGAYISLAPPELVGKYCLADLDMTSLLFSRLAPLVLPTMQRAYDRERRLAPVLADMQIQGVRVDEVRLAADYEQARLRLDELDLEVRTTLHAPTINVDSNDELVQTLVSNGYQGFLTTPTGKLSASKHSLDAALSANPALRVALHARSTLATITGTFMSGWRELMVEGHLHPHYNQTRNEQGFGTRTGRLSSSNPNFQNLPGDLGAEFPQMRSYLLPDEGHMWITGDFSSQEPRIAAHFEDGALQAAYCDDPTLDPYLFVMNLVGGVTRKEAKNVFLGLLYSQGAASLADKLETDVGRATMLRNVIKASLPDIVALDNDCKYRFKRGMSISTLGGRQYHCEPPSNGRDYAYKALNVLIQGSAADQTKQAILHIADNLLPGERIVGTVHDEISVSAPPERVAEIEALMQRAANALPCDVPMVMSVKSGTTYREATK